MKQWVLITGASQGIGYEFTKLFAGDGYDLVLVARDAKRLEEVAKEMTQRHGVKARVLVKDLARPESAREIFDELQREKMDVSILVNNAGYGFADPFAEIDWQRHLDLMQVNMGTLVHLTHLFVKPMLARGEGRILNVASVASFMPGPYHAMYFASKAFVHSFAVALAQELAGSGVTVTTVYPGPTKSQFHKRAGMSVQDDSFIMGADEVARLGYRALLRGKPMVVTGRGNKFFAWAAKILPATRLARTVGRINKMKK